MTHKPPTISTGTACFLVKDGSLHEKYHAPFYTWLQDQGYTLWPGSRGYSEQTDWVYVNLNSRLFCPGIPGIPVTQPVGGHAITTCEFKAIHTLFAKYSHLPPLAMSEPAPLPAAEQDKDQKKREEVLAELKEYWSGMTPEKYRKLVRKDLKTRLGFLSPKELDTYLEEAYKRQRTAEDTAFWLWQMW